MDLLPFVQVKNKLEQMYLNPCVFQCQYANSHKNTREAQTVHKT